MLLHRFDQTLLSELLACLVERFGHSIGVERERVARGKAGTPPSGSPSPETVRARCRWSAATPLCRSGAAAAPKGVRSSCSAGVARHRHIRQRRPWHTRCPPYSRKTAGSPIAEIAAAVRGPGQTGCADWPADSPSAARRQSPCRRCRQQTIRASPRPERRSRSSRRRHGAPGCRRPHNPASCRPGKVCGKSLACTCFAISSSCATRRSASALSACARRCASISRLISSEPSRSNELPSTSQKDRHRAAPQAAAAADEENARRGPATDRRSHKCLRR